MNSVPPFIVEEIALSGVLKITPKVYIDDRGLSAMTYVPEAFAALGITATFVQDYFSHSCKGVIRGMHFQRAPHVQDKLVRCAHGEILDVVVDHDPASPTYGRDVSATLRSSEQTMLYIPGRYAHGFCVTSDEAVVEYKMSDVYHPECAGGVRYDDPVFNIRWPTLDPILSKQDVSWAPVSRRA